MDGKKFSKNDGKKTSSPKDSCPILSPNPAAKILDRLSNEESASLLRILIERHPEIRAEAEQLAKDLVDSPSVEEVADDVLFCITGVDLEALNERAGSHSWGYVEPSEAARELLEESLEDLVADMKRRCELNLASTAEIIGIGIVLGLYQAKDVNSEGALGWDPDFPAEHAYHVVAEFVRSCHGMVHSGVKEQILSTLADHAPEWGETLRRAIQENSSK
ncbi:MAG TPA: hypothetical protein P5186_13250 [Candidatus Paceibacterota bacterium]|nr:hypothetical protein [Verrucomicrobiota bacterium]HRY49007.1 hypothetical protein [Candidatus Paceibacterota bacterium]HRZ99524.1 hypothetical protein [Candidatus Paceibacterota bacterium]